MGKQRKDYKKKVAHLRDFIFVYQINSTYMITLTKRKARFIELACILYGLD